MTTLTPTHVSAPTLRRELGRPWTTVYRWAEKAGLWDGSGSGTPLWFTAEEAAAMRTLDRATSLLGEVRAPLARRIVRERGPVLAIQGDTCASVGWVDVPAVLARSTTVVLVPVVVPEMTP